MFYPFNMKYPVLEVPPSLYYLKLRAVVSGGAEGTLAPPEFVSSVNPIPTGGGRLCPPYYC